MFDRMAPSSYKCGICDKPFYGKHKRLPCKGPCNKVFHPTCVKVGDNEFDLFMVNGVSSFSCNPCTRIRKDDGTPVAASAVRTARKNWAIENDDEGSDESQNKQMDEIPTESMCCCDKLVPKLLDLIQSLEEKVEMLVKNVADNTVMIEKLVCENVSLRDRLSASSEESQSVKSQYSEVVKKRRVAPGRRKVKSAGVTEEVLIPGNSEVGASDIVSDGVVEERERENELPAQSASGEWVKVGDRKKPNKRVQQSRPQKPIKKNAILGKKEAKEHLVVKQRKRALFVTRFDPEVKANEVVELVNDAVVVTDIKCTQLVTKREGYSSFHLSVNENDYEKIASPDVWPRGILVLPFYGRLKEDQILKNESNVSNINQEEVKDAIVNGQ